MATNKKITELPELTEGALADDDVLPIVDISAGTTYKVRKSTLASALAGVSSLTATSPVQVDQSTGSVTVSLDTVPVAKGGTGATTDSGARTNLGLGTIATQSAASVSITGGTLSGISITSGSISGITDLAIADGGTGASDAATARTNLGLASGATTTVGTIATQNASNVSITGGSISGISPGVTIEGSSSGDALRITQTGAGNALVVEDSANPDSSPFVVNASGNVGIANSAPTQALSVGGAASGTVAIQVTNSTAGTAFNDGMQMFINDTAGGFNMREAYPLQFYVNGSERMSIQSNGGVKVVKAAYNAPTTDNDLSFDQNATNNFKCTPSGTGTLTFTNHTAGQSGNILLINTGGHAISLAATTKGDANLATTISTAGTYWLSYYDDGTNAYVTTSAAFA